MVVPENLTVIVLAAGSGTRMKSTVAKVLHAFGGRTLVGHVLHAVAATQPTRIVVVVGTQADQVAAHVRGIDPRVMVARQPLSEPGGPRVPYGTAYAVMVGMDALRDAPGSTGLRADDAGAVLVVTADTPLLTGSALVGFVAEHHAAEHAVSILSGRVPEPLGYGRILRGDDGDVVAIVEERDATPEQRTVNEINSGILAFDQRFLVDALPRISNDNAKGELYLTDTVGIAREAGLTVGAHCIDDVMQTEGVNDRVQLAALGREFNTRLLHDWMRRGVSVADPATTWVDADVILGEDVTLLPGTQLCGRTTVGTEAVIGPETTLRDCVVGAGARIERTSGESAEVGAGAVVGPFGYLPPGARIDPHARTGAFCDATPRVARTPDQATR